MPERLLTFCDRGQQPTEECLSRLAALLSRGWKVAETPTARKFHFTEASLTRKWQEMHPAQVPPHNRFCQALVLAESGQAGLDGEYLWFRHLYALQSLLSSSRRRSSMPPIACSNRKRICCSSVFQAHTIVFPLHFQTKIYSLVGT